MAQQRKPVAKLTTIHQLALLPGDIDELKALKATDKDIMDKKAALLKLGWRFEEMENNQGDGYSILVKMSSPGNVNASSGFYANGDTYRAATICAIYKIEILGDKAIGDFLLGRGSTNAFG